MTGDPLADLAETTHRLAAELCEIRISPIGRRLVEEMELHARELRDRLRVAPAGMGSERGEPGQTQRSSR